MKFFWSSLVLSIFGGLFCLGTAAADLQVYYGDQPLPQEVLKTAKFDWPGVEAQKAQRQGSPYLEPSNRLLFTVNQPSFTLVGSFSRVSLHPLAQGRYYLDYLKGPADDLALEGGAGSVRSLEQVYFVLDGQEPGGRVSISDFSSPIWSEYEETLDFRLTKESPQAVQLQTLRELKCGRHLLLVDGRAFTFYAGRCDFYTYAIKHKKEVLTALAHQTEAPGEWRRAVRPQGKASPPSQPTAPTPAPENPPPAPAATVMAAPSATTAPEDYSAGGREMDQRLGARLGRDVKHSNLFHPQESLVEGKLFDDGAAAKRHADEIIDTKYPNLPPQERERIKEDVAQETRKDLTVTGTQTEYKVITTLKWLNLLGADSKVLHRLVK